MSPLPPHPHVETPDPDAIRQAIDAADEHAKQLRRLLWATLCLRMDYSRSGLPTGVAGAGDAHLANAGGRS